MKVYMIGTAYLEETLDTFPYLIALIAFSLAVIDGPNIVERLFGIDAGLKNGWGVLAEAYAGSKLLSGTGKLAAQGADFMTGSKLSNTKDSLAKFGNRNRKGINNSKSPSPNASTKNGIQTGTSNSTGEYATARMFPLAIMIIDLMNRQEHPKALRQKASLLN